MRSQELMQPFPQDCRFQIYRNGLNTKVIGPATCKGLIAVLFINYHERHLDISNFTHKLNPLEFTVNNVA